MKKLIILGMAAAVLFMAVGCTKDSTVDTNNTTDENEDNTDVIIVDDIDDDSHVIPVDENDTDYYVSPTDGVEVGHTITIGDIMVFEGNYIHIIAGDLVQVYEYDSSQQSEYYLGQTVSLIKGEDMDYIEPYITEDFDNHYTNMGHLLVGITGEITNLTNEEITVESDEEEITVTTYSELTLAAGTHVTLYYAYFVEGQQPSLVMIFNEDTKLNLTVTAINRGENGEMLLDMTDAEVGEYIVNASSCLLEVNLSEISVGDELVVYHEGIMESWPMQLMTTLITQNK